MKVLRIFSSIFWIVLMMIACNTTPENHTAEGDDQEVENAELNTDEKTDAVADEASANSLEGEEFPGNGYKGREGDYVFYIETSEEGISGFVRHKDSGEENEISGQMSSPFDFDAEEVGEDEDGDEMTLAKIRGKMGDDGSSIEIDYNDTNSAKTFRLELKK
jgi:hypothetical protein